MALVATVGLETHVQLNTRSKIWCGCRVESDAPPNTHVCPVCLGYPGSLPVLNEEAVRKTVIAGTLLGCTINPFSKHDRKSYFYPDMPKNYQITQYDQPFCSGGGIEIEVNGRKKMIRINRIHLEEDVGKSTHFDHCSGLDYNRAGTPLMEIVTEADLSNEDEAIAYLSALKQILQYGGVSHCNLENGNIRCDVNTSVAEADAAELGTKSEIKNMNTFRGIHAALAYEIRRQKDVVGGGGSLVQETRRWDDLTATTQSMRTKEYAHDYRYFPDPDLAPVVLSDAQIADWTRGLPELPHARRIRYQETFGLPEYDAGVLVADKQVADFFEQVVQVSGNPKAASNWVMTEVLRVLSEGEQGIDSLKLTSDALGALIKLVDAKTLNSTKAKEVFAVLLEEGGDPATIVKDRGLAQVSDSGAIETFVEQVISENPKVVEDYRGGKQAALQFLMGQVMRLSKGKANPPMVLDLLREKLVSS